MLKTKDFVKAIAEKSGNTQKVTKSVLDAATEVISEVIPNDSVKALGVTFSTKVVDAHEGRNPSTGEVMTIPAKRQVRLKASRTLKEAVAALD